MNVIISCYALSPCLGKKRAGKGKGKVGGGGGGTEGESLYTKNLGRDSARL